jgi:ABC-type metal ion transport system, permease component
MFSETVIKMLGMGILETLYMTLFSSFIAYILGLPVGILLVITDRDGITPNVTLNKVVGVIVNIVRSIPFIILLIAIMPVTRAITGTTIGVKAVVIPLIASSAPYIARIVESSLKEVDKGVVEAAQSMGASPWQIVFKVLIPEAKPSLVIGSAIAISTILSYTVMAGFVGGGGLGDIAIRYGYYRYETGIMMVAVILLIVILQVIQELGSSISKKSDKRI